MMLDAYVLNSKFETVSIIDNYESFIWTDRFDQYGDFELVMTASKEMNELFASNSYLYINQSERLMFIEKIEINSDAEDGDKLTITGRSLESLLDRRVIWDASITYTDTEVQTIIQDILKQNVYDCSNTNRNISNFKMTTTTDTTITEIKTDATYNWYDGTNVYDAIASLCQDNKIGFKITVDVLKNFVFELYNGTDRSFDQGVNPYVIFSQNFENLSEADFVKDTTNYKNVSVITSSKYEGGTTKDDYSYDVLNDSDYTGLDRRETSINAGVSTDNASSWDDYKKLMDEKAQEDLDDKKIEKTFTGEVDANNTYECGVDYFVGDIVEVIDQYGNEAVCRVTEVIWNQDSDGYKCYPTFESIEEGVTIE